MVPPLESVESDLQMNPPAPNRKIRVMLVEDHVLVRVGITTIVNAEPDMEIVVELGSGHDALQNFEQFAPDVVVLDLRMPGHDGVEVMRRLRQKHGQVKCLILSSYDGADEITRAMRQGACGYILKSMASDHLLAAIRSAHAGGRYVLQEISDRIKRATYADLSARELEVLRLIAGGKSNKEIAAVFDVVEGTVKGHVTNILAKLGVMDRTQAIVEAVKRGIINLE